MLETLGSFQVRCSASSWNQPCNFSCIFNRCLLLFTNSRCSKSSSSLSVMDGKMQGCIKCPSPWCFILLLRALILSGIVPVISGLQEKNIITCCLSTALLILLCLLLEWRDWEDVSLEQGNRAAATGMELAWDGAGALTPLLTAISAPAAKRGRPLN